eukprot:Lithocolla_globosa_v1_NODE_4785_length_1366_cov_35.699466.p3 type:complete len:133 gc:universal NODE_4785_length_1366_cov_35.699466:574-176(-)
MVKDNKNQHSHRLPFPQRLSASISQWKNISTNPLVIDWLENGFPIPLSHWPPQINIPNPLLSVEEEQFLDLEILNLLEIGCIQQTLSRPHVVSPIKTAPKPGGNLRIILNLFQFNQYVQAPQFTYEDIKTGE